jgi:DNA-binding SARP family transcriptional activator/class 3 adenylate cyclase/tetratricopeptide (TPR) repeat protein
MARLSLFLLGPFRATLDGDPITRFATNKVRALLAYLGVEIDRPHPRSSLAGLLWPDWPERSALANLRNALANLRAAIGDRSASPPWLLITRETIQFNAASDHWIDVAACGELLQAGTVTSEPLEQAIALYRGPFMESFSAGDSTIYEDWMSLTRERLQRQVLAAFQRLIERHEGQGKYGRACEAAWRWIELAPWQEGAHQALMRLLALSGQRGAALAQYEACRRALQEELAVEPGEETRRLYERIRDGELGPRQEPVPVRGAARGAEQVPGPASSPGLPNLQDALPSPREVPARAGQSPARPERTQLTPSPRGPPSPEAQRRVVTALRAGVQGVAAPGIEIDAEDWAEIMGHVFQVLGAEIQRYGGEIVQFRGDGLLATFGLAAAHEDDPERAVLAALAMQGTVEAYAAGLREREGIDLLLRVGVNTGDALAVTVDKSHHQEEMAMGRAVATAARTEAAAEPGTVLVAEDTYRLVAPLFEWQAPGGVAVEGDSRSWPAYRPLRFRALAGKGRGIAGLESPLVGRDAESRALQEAVRRLRAGVGGIVTVIGEAGIGKSRLVAEVCKQELGLTGREPSSGALAEIRAVAQGPSPTSGLGWVEGRCLSYASGDAYQLWLDTLHGLLGVAPDAPPATVRQAMQAWLRAICPERYDDVYPYLGHLASLPLEEEAEAALRGLGAQGLKAFTFRAVEALIESAARQRPQVIVSEDLHWADPTSLELLERLLSLTDRVPVLYVCVLRPQMGHGCWRIVETAARDYPHRHTDLRLAPLSRADSETLVGNLLHIEALPTGFRERILDRAEGNPFYVEEILRQLMHSGAIDYEEDTGRWRATRGRADMAIPGTLRGVLAARIDHLDPGARYVLQRASVIGRAFSYRVLSAITTGCPLLEEGGLEEALDGHLVTLQRAQLIRERARLPELEYMFKHHLTQEAAYDGLLRRERRLCHRQVAQALERFFPERIEEQLGLLAHHWERAGEAGRAVDYLRQAGEQAAGRFANAEAAGYFSRALELTPEDRLAERCALLLGREEAYRLQGMREAQARDLAELERAAAALGDPRLRAQVALRQAHYAMRLNDYGAALVHIEGAVELAQAAQDAGGQLMGYRLWTWILGLQGNNETAMALGERALALARQQEARLMEGALLRDLGVVARSAGHYAQAQAHGEESLRSMRELGDRWNEGTALICLSQTYMEAGDHAEAETSGAKGLHILREIGDPWGEGLASWALGEALACQSNYVEGGTCCEQAVRAMGEMGDQFYEVLALASLARVLRWQGRYNEAETHLDLALRIAREVGERVWEGRVLVPLSLVFHNMGDDRMALGYGEQALRLAQEFDFPHFIGYALTYLGHALLGLDRPAEAAAAYRRALALRREIGQRHLVPEPLAGLARVAMAQDDLPQAQAHVGEILSYLEAHPALDGTDEPIRTYLTCYRVLQAGADPRAEGILDAAYHLLQEQAAQFDDQALRRSFLENVLAHRELAGEWTRGHGAAGSG